MLEEDSRTGFIPAQPNGVRALKKGRLEGRQVWQG